MTRIDVAEGKVERIEHDGSLLHVAALGGGMVVTLSEQGLAVAVVEPGSLRVLSTLPGKFTSVDALGDVDGDGNPEIVARTLDDSLMLASVKGRRLHEQGRTTLSPRCEGREVSVTPAGDVDGDGRGEAIVESACHELRSPHGIVGDPLEQVEVWSDVRWCPIGTSLDCSRKPLSAIEHEPHHFDHGWPRALAVGDVDGDAHDDLLVYRYHTGLRSGAGDVYEALFEDLELVRGQDGGPSAEPHQSITWSSWFGRSTVWATPIGDIDGDGLADVALNDHLAVAVARGSKTGLVRTEPPGWLASLGEGLLPQGEDIDEILFATADVDGDAKREVVVRMHDDLVLRPSGRTIARSEDCREVLSVGGTE